MMLQDVIVVFLFFTTAAARFLSLNVLLLSCSSKYLLNAEVEAHSAVVFCVRYCFPQAHLNYGGSEGTTLNRKFKYSRYKAVKTYKDPESGSTYSCCAFSVSSVTCHWVGRCVVLVDTLPSKVWTCGLRLSQVISAQESTTHLSCRFLYCNR